MQTDRIAIFPLQHVVLFPHVTAPLHLFEPRYRQLAAEAIAGDRRIGMVTVPTEHVPELPGEPPVHPVGCMGRIAQHRRRPDGRYDILLAGERRFRIVSEPTTPDARLYRVAEVAWLDDPLPDAASARISELRGVVADQVRDLVARSQPQQPDAADHDVLPDTGDAVFVNTLCTALAFAPQEKQRLLETDSVVERFELLEGLLAFRLASLGQARSGPERVH